MKNLLADCRIEKTESYDAPFLNKVDIYQDGTVPFCRDKNGKLWGISGHSHCGHIGMFCGNDLRDMKEVYPIHTDFSVGAAGVAFAGIRYPEGIQARGSIWPFGLYICPGTGRFFAFFHNESGWNGQGTAYDSLGLCQQPKMDTDFRHVGLMHSDDEGRNWIFDRWVLSGENVCFTEKYNPDGINVIGQKEGVIRLGSGDFSLYIPADGEYIYMFYNIIKVNMYTWLWEACDTYVARTRKRADGIMGDFVKYYEGSFCEAGNFGKETAISQNTWHSRVAYSEKIGCYLMSSAPMRPNSQSQIIADYMELRTSEDMLHWSEPISLSVDGQRFGNHYNAVISVDGTGDPYRIIGKEFTTMTCHNGTDVLATNWKIDG